MGTPTLTDITLPPGLTHIRRGFGSLTDPSSLRVHLRLPRKVATLMNRSDETAIAAASRNSAESAMAVKDTIKDQVVVVENAVASLAVTSANAAAAAAGTSFCTFFSSPQRQE